MWFVSGIAMIYARDMPRLTPSARLRHMRSLDLRAVRLTPQQAADRADLQRPGQVSLLTLLGRPAYRFSTDIVFADTGERLPEVGKAESLAIASLFMSLPQSELHYIGRLEQADQWTIGQPRQLPLHKITADDGARTEVYVSERLAEVVVETTRGSRALAWISAIPHWLYFSSLRLNDALWRQVVLWTSGLGIVSVLIGLVLAVTQYRVRYAGLMRWHYIAGALFGIFALTWVFSGMLSMEPWYWASSSDAGASVPDALSGGPLALSDFPSAEPDGLNRAQQGHAIKQIDFRRLQGEPYYLLRGAESSPILVPAGTLQTQDTFSADSVLRRVRQVDPAVNIAESDVLGEYDAYYYDRDGEAPLPVLRIKFDDPERTWIYIDLTMSEMVARFTRRERVQRWLYHGLHSLDFPFLYYRRPLWDIVTIALCTGGAVLSVLGAILAFRRVRILIGASRTS